MKRILFTVISFSLFLFSCNKEKENVLPKTNNITEITHSIIPLMPECADKSIKQEAISNFNSQVKEVLKQEYFEKNINYSDIRDYANSNNLLYDDVLTTEKNKIESSATQYAEGILINTNLRNIITNKIEKDIKKCECTAEIVNDGLINDITVFYTAQYSEDGILNVILDYNTPH